MLVATILTRKHIRFDVTVVSSFGRFKYTTDAADSSKAWQQAADYCGDDACGITVTPASVQ